MMVFGALSLEKLSINSGLLIFKDLTVEGFWLSTWIEGISDAERGEAFQAVFGFLLENNTKVDIEGKFPLEEFRDALEAYHKPGRNGKILLVSDFA